MASSSSVTHLFQPAASLLPLLHAARWPSSVVVGCLLGTVSAEGSKNTRSGTASQVVDGSNDIAAAGSSSRELPVTPVHKVNGKGKGKETAYDGDVTARYTHAIPLLHHWTGLSMAFEAGMDMVEEYANSNGLQILAFYYAPYGLPKPALLSDNSNIPLLIQRLQQQLALPKKTGSASWVPRIFVLDNTSLTTESAFRLLQAPAATASEDILFLQNASHDASPTRLASLIKQGLQDKVADWDDHLEDLGARWLKNDAIDLSIEVQ